MAASPWIVFATEYDPFLIPDSNKQLNNDLPLSKPTQAFQQSSTHPGRVISLFPQSCVL